MVAVLGTVLGAVEAIVGAYAVVAYTDIVVEQATALTVLVTNVASIPSEETITFAFALLGVQRAMHAVQVARITLLSPPEAIAQTGAIIL